MPKLWTTRLWVSWPFLMAHDADGAPRNRAEPADDRLVVAELAVALELVKSVNSPST
jgi:hypothetical protein